MGIFSGCGAMNDISRLSMFRRHRVVAADQFGDVAPEVANGRSCCAGLSALRANSTWFSMKHDLVPTHLLGIVGQRLSAKPFAPVRWPTFPVRYSNNVYELVILEVD
jgi:hypothetical protein